MNEEELGIYAEHVKTQVLGYVDAVEITSLNAKEKLVFISTIASILIDKIAVDHGLLGVNVIRAITNEMAAKRGIE